MESKKKNGTITSHFQMPLHYPRYTKKDYQDMPEGRLDRLLAEYGLAVSGDIAYKRQFAMGAFLWPEIVQAPCSNSFSSRYFSFQSSSFNKNKL